MAKQAEHRTQKVQKARQEAARHEARRRRVVLTIGGLVIVGLVAAIVWAVVRASGDPQAPAAGAEVVAPANLAPSGAIPIGASAAPVTVRVYYDYMCPACGMFEAANGEELKRLVDDGRATLELWPISFLDEQSSGTQYSTRAANAIATVTDGAPDAVWAMHSSLYANQPKEGSEGLSDDQIGDLATSAGVPEGVVDRFTDGEFRPWVESMTQQAFGAGVQGTPTVLIDGEVFEGDLYTPGPLTQAIQSAAGE
jgi:protein-disulfide isomerase